MTASPEELLKDYVRNQQFSSTTEVMGAMKNMFRDVLQQVMECELEAELGYEKSQRVSNNGADIASKNYRNGYSKKTVKTQLGEIELNIPRDRNGVYEPQIIGKYNRNVDGMEEKILALYGCGMRQQDIAEQIKNLYDIEISPELVSKITEKIMPEVNAWQNRALDSCYPFVFMDAIHYKVKDEHHYVTKAAYVVLGITIEGTKEVLGIWIGEHESSKFWLGVLNDLKSRGVQQVHLFCVDGLKGFPEAIAAVYPKAKIIHQIRYSTKFVSYKDIKELMVDLKLVYTAVNEKAAWDAFVQFKAKWNKQYPSCVSSWENNWHLLSTYFAYLVEMRKLIYTTNIIEGLHRQFRQVTKNKPSFQNDNSLRKLLYLAIQKISAKWVVRCRNWDMISNQLKIVFEEENEVLLTQN